MADFNYFLNRQGPRGQQGLRGPEGYSPIITVNKNTLSEYILRIQTLDSDFLTPNLRPNIINNGGTYIRYNQSTQELSAAPADVASEAVSGIVRFATDEEVADRAESVVISPADIDTAIAQSNVTSGLQEQISTNASKIAAIEDNYVTTNTAQTITQSKKFTLPIEACIIDGIQYISGAGQDTSFIGVDNEKGVISTIANRFGNDKYETYLVGKSVEVRKGENYYPIITTENVASTTKTGIVKPDGTTITVDADGTIHGASTYELPKASNTTLGGIKIGEGLTIASDGTVTAIGGGDTVMEKSQTNPDGTVTKVTNTISIVPSITISTDGQSTGGDFIFKEAVRTQIFDGDYPVVDTTIVSDFSLREITVKLQALTARVTALENEINGGSATSPTNPVMTGLHNSVRTAENIKTNIGEIRNDTQ